MQRIPVESSDIVAVGYEPKGQLLEIEFHQGRIYQYSDVPQNVYDLFLKADSLGNYFNTYINKRYKYRRIDDAAQESAYDAVAFVTGNADKFREFEQVCSMFEFPVEQLELPVEEIQSPLIEEVIKHKTKRAYALAGRPIVVSDHFWNILALRGFPGAYMKEVNEWLRPEEFLALMADKKDWTVSRTEALMYYDGKRFKLFAKIFNGMIVDAPRGKGSSIDQIVVMQGETHTMAELQNAHAANSVEPQETVTYDFAKWFAMQRKLQAFTRS